MSQVGNNKRIKVSPGADKNDHVFINKGIVPNAIGDVYSQKVANKKLIFRNNRIPLNPIDNFFPPTGAKKELFVGKNYTSKVTDNILSPEAANKQPFVDNKRNVDTIGNVVRQEPTKKKPFVVKRPPLTETANPCMNEVIKKKREAALKLHVFDAKRQNLYYQTSVETGYCVHLARQNRTFFCVDLPPQWNGFPKEDGVEIVIGGESYYKSPTPWNGVISEDDNHPLRCFTFKRQNGKDVEILALFFAIPADPCNLPSFFHVLGPSCLGTVVSSCSWVNGEGKTIDFLPDEMVVLEENEYITLV